MDSAGSRRADLKKKPPKPRKKPKQRSGLELNRKHSVDRPLLKETALSTVLHASPIGIAVVCNRVITQANDRMCEMTGYSREELTDKDARLLYPTQEEYDRVGEEKYRQIKEGGVGSLETNWLRKNGTVLDVYLTSMAVDPKDDSKGIISTVLDITDRKRAEVELRELKQKYKNTVDMLPQIVFEVDRDGNLAFLNKHGFALTGYTEEDLAAGLDPAELVVVEDRERLAENIRKHIGGEGNTGNEYRLYTADGRNIPIISYVVPIVDGDEVVGFRGVAFDISDRKKAEEALRASEAHYRSVVEDQSEYIVRWLPDGTRTFVNEAFCRYRGQPPEVLVGGKVMDLMAPEDRERVLQQITSLTPEEPVRSIEFCVTPPNGTSVWHRWTDRGIFDGEGKLVGIQSVGRDVSDRKELEEQLVHSQKMEAVGRLAGGLAHEFNNLLTAILGYSQFALDALKEGDPVRDHVRIIRQSGERASELVENLLAFSRKQPREPKAVDLNETVTGMQEMLRHLIGENVQLYIALEKDLWPIKADPNQLSHIIMNLAINARDAMPEGGQLCIETYNVKANQAYSADYLGMKPGDYAMMLIGDSGIGMDEETRLHMFDPFFTTKERGKGTGLGLAIVYGIVKQSDGHIRAYSEPGKGTTIRVYLPRTDETSDEVRSAIKVSSATAGSETVLLVEDQDVVRSLAGRILREQGYNILEARDGAEAIRGIEEHDGRIHLLLVDVVMPGLSGPELADRLLTFRPEMKVLYMTGYTESEVLGQGMLEADRPLIRKPFTVDGLALKVREVLDAGQR